MTVTPASATTGAKARLAGAPAANRAMSRPAQSAVAASSTGTTSRPPVQRPAGGAGGGEQAQASTGKSRSARIWRITAADLAGGSDDADVHARQATRASRRPRRITGPGVRPPQFAARSKASWRATTARSSSSSGTTQVMRMAEVEIISMLIPSPASVSNIVAATPGVRLHARADEADPWRCWASVVTPTAPISSASAPVIVAGSSARSSRGTREGDVGDAVLGHVLHDHVDVDVGVGQRAEQPGGDAGLVGHAGDGDLGLATSSCTTPETMACSMAGPPR